MNESNLGARMYTKSLYEATFDSGKILCYPSCEVNVYLKEDSFTYAISIKQGVGLFWKLRVSEIRVNQGVAKQKWNPSDLGCFSSQCALEKKFFNAHASSYHSKPKFYYQLHSRYHLRIF